MILAALVAFYMAVQPVELQPVPVALGGLITGNFTGGGGGTGDTLVDQTNAPLTDQSGNILTTF